MDSKNQLLWYFDHLSEEGRNTLLNIARAFVATGTFARMPELSKEAREHMQRLQKAIDARMEEF